MPDGSEEKDLQNEGAGTDEAVLQRLRQKIGEASKNFGSDRDGFNEAVTEILVDQFGENNVTVL